MATWPLQNSSDRLQVVGFRSLTHRSMRQGQYFPAHFDSVPYNPLGSVCNTFSENESKMRPKNVEVGYRTAVQTFCLTAASFFRAKIIQSALDSTESCSSNGESNLFFDHLGLISPFL